MKKALGVGLALATAVALSACELDTSTVINADGTGTYTVQFESDKAEVATEFGVSESEIVGVLEDAVEDSVEEADDIPTYFDYEIVDLGENLLMAMDVSFTFDREGWAFDGPDGAPTGVSVVLDQSGESATLSMDPTDHNPFVSIGPVEAELSFTATFPGPVTNATGGGNIDGHTVTWEHADLQGVDIVEATGSLGGAVIPEAPGTDPEAPEPEPEPVETPTTEPEATESPEPEATHTAEPADENDEQEDRRRDEEDRPVADDGGFDIPWRAIVMTGLGIVGLTGITIAIIFLIRGKSSGNSAE